MHNPVIVAAKRTPIGRKDGMFRDKQAEELASPLLAVMAKGLEKHIDEVLLGNVVGPGGNLARLSALSAGLPQSITGMTIDRQCAAGLEAIRTAALFIQAEVGECYIAGGTESTSTSPNPGKARFSPDSLGDPEMGEAAENVASQYGISRAEQDEWAHLSYQRSIKAYEDGLFQEEIYPIDGSNTDEIFLKPRPLERLIARAKPAFKKNGTVTAMNSCGVNDGAAAVLIMSEQKARKLGMKPVLRVVGSAVTGIDPNIPAIAPVSAIHKLLTHHSLSVQDIDLFEINEAFAVKIAACSKQLSIPYEKLNIHGGAIALGHPYGASGAILVTRLFHEARRSDIRYMVAAMGSGGGIGTAILFEKAAY
ncbi:MAG TPA: acetyl-CoA C-acyltransferase [Chondromyces sp.]|nr:acetyl-CoA C-acyltransferase [Chondromyces sp.]